MQTILQVTVREWELHGARTPQHQRPVVVCLANLKRNAISQWNQGNKQGCFLQLIFLDDDQRKAMHFESWYPIIRNWFKRKKLSPINLGFTESERLNKYLKDLKQGCVLYLMLLFSLSACSSRSGCKKRFGWYWQGSEDIGFRSYQRRIRSRHISQTE